MKHKVVLVKCPMCNNECDKNDSENYINVSYNYWRDWKGDGEDGSWVVPRRLLVCSDCSDKHCDYVGESHLRDHPPLWVFKTPELLQRYYNSLGGIVLDEMATEEKERVIKMAKKLTEQVSRYNPYNSLRIQYVDHVGEVIIEYQSCGDYKLPEVTSTTYKESDKEVE